MVTQEGAPSLGGRPGSLDHLLRDARLGDFKAEFEQLAMDARGPHSGLSALIRRISARRSAAICGRPPRERDFQRQYRRKPDRCQRSRVSGRIISLRVERGAWSVAYTVLAVIAWSIAAVIACSVAAVIACSIAVMSVPVSVATIPHALAYREIALVVCEIGH